MSVQIRLLGGVEVRAGRRAVDVGHPRQQCVLVALLADLRACVPAEQLIERVWGDAPPRRGRSTLYSYLSRLRQALEESGAARIERRDGGYTVEVDPMAVDLHCFARWTDEARTAEPARARLLLEQAVALRRGALLPRIDTPWLNDLRALLDERHRTAEADLMDLRLGSGEHAEVLGELQRLAADHPLDEGRAGRLMLALYRSGRQADALEYYERTRRELVKQLGIDPGPQLRRLHLRILAADPALEVARPAPALAAVTPTTAPQPPGPQPTASSSTAPPSAAPRLIVPRQLPRPIAGFVGRAGELDALEKELASPGPMLVSISGMAGIGKTSLAIQWTQRARGHFPDGQLFVDLRGHGPGRPLRPVEALAGFLVALNVPPDRVPSDEEQASALFRSAVEDRRMVVVLDNAGSVDQVRALLPGATGVPVLVTSRNRLTGLVAREGARELPLGVLGEDESVELIRRTAGERQPPGAEETGRSAALALARLCGRLPLALRIAAAQASSEPGAGLEIQVARLGGGNRLDQLAVRGDEAAAVRVAFDHSYTALDPDLRRLFRLLGLLPFTDFPAALADVLLLATRGEESAGPQAPARNEVLLRRLVDAHLVNHSSEGRYQLHDLLRQYARDLVLVEEPDAARAAVVRGAYSWYGRYAGAAAAVMFPQLPRVRSEPDEGAAFPDPGRAATWLADERHNLVTATVTAAEACQPETAWLLADALRGYYMAHRNVVEWTTVAQAGLEAAERHGDARARAAMQLNQAVIANCTGDLTAAVDHYRQAIRLAVAAGWLVGEATGHANLGIALSIQGHSSEAAEQQHRALAVNRRLGRSINVAINLQNLGTICGLIGRIDTAIEYLQESLALHRAANNERGQAAALINLGISHHQRQELDAARDCLQEARRLDRKLGHVDGESTALAYLACVELDAGAAEQVVLKLARTAAAILHGAGDPYAEAVALNALATTQHRFGHRTVARLHHRRALRLADSCGSRQPAVVALIGLAELNHEAGSRNDAEQLARRARDLAAEAGYRPLESRAGAVLTALSQAHPPAADYGAARRIHAAG
ncbi:BTAD domain-containing putative transcriptional regulator [Kitasatospora sp. NPDC050463]|uniref:AfsR/SARP family transcriptional regulator n=1 Tax=Kitasatospora sp. NPDC050463 TaxID=3155786 RepID=UPI0033F8541C